jgi:hypothetical protein
VIRNPQDPLVMGQVFGLQGSYDGRAAACGQRLI